jgi:organic radical activating enzyme
MLDCTPEGNEEITAKTYNDFRNFIKNRQKNILILISGGEPTLHPKWHEYANQLCQDGFMVILLSNGMFLDDENQIEKLQIIRKSFPKFMVQITHDNRYYPLKINYKTAKKLGLEVVKQIGSELIPLGRAKDLTCLLKHPKCINPKLIKLQRPDSDLWDIIDTLNRFEKFCFPLIGIDGKIYAGETMTSCQSIGTIYDDPQLIAENINKLTCNNCGLNPTSFN